MNKIIYIFLFIFLSFSEASSLNKLTSIQKNYVLNYIQSVNSNDLKSLKELTHKSYLNCITSENMDYYDTLFQKTLSRTISKDFKVNIEVLTNEKREKEFNGAQKRGIPYPIKPTHILQIDYSKGEYSYVTIIRNLVFENNKYYEISGCPNDKMIKKYREIIIKNAQNRKKARKLFLELKEPFLSELTLLLKDGQKIKAWKKYSEVTGETLSMSKDVLSYIEID